MPLTDTLGSFATEEYRRFLDGVRLLHPDAAADEMVRRAHRAMVEGRPRTINIPGWDDVVTLRPRYQPTAADRTEYWAARQARRAPNLPAEVLDELDRRRSRVRGMQDSAAPGWDKGFGQILTAIDNVQDLASTVSTLGRLALWLAPRAALRFLPGVGPVLLVSDLLNLLSFFGMIATPLYGLVCAGPADALAAGVPAALFKRALKAEAWKMAFQNPFGREARGRRALRALPGLPRLTGLLEAAQTTQALWGVGLTLGGLVGMLTESAHAAVLRSRGQAVDVNTQPLVDSFRRLFNEPLEDRSPGELLVTLQAARVLATAPAVFVRPEQFDDGEVLLALVAWTVATDHVATVLRGKPWQDTLAEATRRPFRPVVAPDDFSVEVLAAGGLEPPYPAVFATAGDPETLTGDEYDRRVTAPAHLAMTRWLHGRRNAPEGALAGALISSTTELWLHAAEEDPELMAWELAPDAAVLAAVAESGHWPSVGGDSRALWAWWRELRELHREQGPGALTDGVILPAAARHGVTMMRLLPPGSPWPAAWGLDSLGPKVELPAGAITRLAELPPAVRQQLETPPRAFDTNT